MSKRVKKVYRTLRRPIEWCFIGLGLLIVPPLSLARLLVFSRWVADTAYTFDSRGKMIARANLRLMFGSRMTPIREAALIRRSYRNMARVVLNVLWMSRDTRARLADQVSFNPGVLETLRRNTPIVTVSAHLGNWEILSQACVANGVPMLSVAKQVGSPEMTAHLIRMRSTIGQQLVPAEGALRPLLRALKNGTSIGLLIDQYTSLADGGTWVTLFGVPAGISMAPAALARKTRTPIIFAWSRPLKDGRYRIEPGQLFPYDPLISDAERAQQMASAFERVIRRHPSLWCLNYCRWRYIRPGDDPARYPLYARFSKRDVADNATT